MLLRDEIMPMLTIKDVARLLHIHVNTARRWSDQGILKSYRITRRGDRRFRQEDIARFLAEYNDFNTKKEPDRETAQGPANDKGKIAIEH
jgi:excisionase family DNA binding protein